MRSGPLCPVDVGGRGYRLGMADLARAEHFIWLSARVLEQCRFAFLFREGSADGVAAALAAYRTSDGGCAFGLEPDLRGPVSQPLSVHAALLVLDEIGRCSGEPCTSAVDHLVGLTRPDGGIPAVNPAAADYPHPPFMPVDPDPPSALLSTALVAGVLHRNSAQHPWLGPATEFCWRAIEALTETHPYEVHAAVAFLDHVPDRRRAAAAAERLGGLVREQRIVVLDPHHPEEAHLPPGYAEGEWHFVPDYARNPRSLASSWFSDEEITAGLDALERDQGEDGGWPIRWRQWAPGTALESRPRATIDALLTLRAHGR